MARGNADGRRSLVGKRILVVDDEMVVAMSLGELLTDLGCDVVIAARVAKALHLVATVEIDAAILDVNVAGENVYPVAQELRERGIPFVFSSGYGKARLAPDYSNRPTLTKPFYPEALAPMLADIIHGK